MKIDLVTTGYIFNGDKVLLIHHRKLDAWLPVGGHIKTNETFDDALKREIKEETNLEVEIIGQKSLPLTGSVKQNLAVPFYVNLHSVGDHDHCCLYYICRALNPTELKIKTDEVIAAKWYSQEELKEKTIPADIKDQALMAFKILDI